MSGQIPESDVEFVEATNTELGYTYGCTVAQTYKAAAKFGLELCQPVDAPLARLAYPQQKTDTCRLVAMEPITGYRGDLQVFGLQRDGSDSLLVGCYGAPGIIYDGVVRWVFRRKRS